MKKVFILLIGMLFCASIMTAQSGFRTMSSDGLDKQEIETSQVSLNNAWFGSNFSYQLTGDQSFDDNFLFNTNILYNVDFDGSEWNFPVVGEISLPTSGEGLDNVDVGIYPWRIVSNGESSFIWVVHGGVSYKVSPEETSELSQQSFRLLAGVEVSFPLNTTSTLPITISLTPLFETHNLDIGSNFGLEGTFIIPIAANLGAIGELYVPFSSEMTTSFNAGVIVNGALSK